MAGQLPVGAVAEVRGERCAGAHGVLDLAVRGLKVADGDDRAFTDQVLDVARRFGPFRRDRDQAGVALGGVLPAMEFLDIRRAHPARGMGAARTVVRRDMRALDVEAFEGAAVRELALGAGQVAQGPEHGFGRAGDDGRKKTRDAGAEKDFERAGDLVLGRVGIAVIDAGEAVDLEVDEAGR